MRSLPSFIEDDILGRMDYNPDLSWYEGWLDDDRLGLPVEISLPAKSQRELDSYTDLLRRAIGEIDSLIALAKTAAQRAYYDTGYLNAPTFDAQGFRDRLELTTLWINDNGAVVCSFSTENMFPGHAVKVEFDSDLSNAAASLW